MTQFSVIIPAAGSSTRFGGNRRKPFEDLDGRAVWLRTVEHFCGREDVADVVVVIAADDLDEFKDRFRANFAFLEVKVATGGASRAESVRNGMSALEKPCDYIAVHDAARPVLTRNWITQIFEQAQQHKAVIPGLKISSTVKRVDESGQIVETIDRTCLRLAQTPQVFERSVLEKAYEVAGDPSDFTDEAALVENSGHPVVVCEGWPMNIKITTRDDMQLASAYLKSLPAEGGLAGLDLLGN